MLRQDLLAAFDACMQPENFKDYGPNGLQVEGRPEVSTLVSGVTASRALIEAAIEQQADAIVVHHGLFWRGQNGTVTGWMKQRLALLLQHDINLFAYHLPLDAHPELGNNAQLAQLLGLTVERQLGEQNLLFVGRPAQGAFQGAFANAQSLAQHVRQKLDREVICVDGLPQGAAIERLAWCTGGGQGFFEQAIEAGAQAYITGEISEPQAHYARECGVAFLACGHHATERYGVQALASRIAAQHGLRHIHIDIDNPA
ncbi:MAG: Nif3-like dinuclear metal center hexameric protein [Brachymonas sp.]|nr:Nif3-like dinuclear metal center hexameric protein [Brachymonas sp.]